MFDLVRNPEAKSLLKQVASSAPESPGWVKSSVVQFYNFSGWNMTMRWWMGKSHQNSLTQATKTWPRVWTTSPLTGRKWGRKLKKMLMNAWSARRGFLWSHFCLAVIRLSAQTAGDNNYLLDMDFIVGSQLEGEEVPEVQGAGGEQEDTGDF